MKVYFKTFHVRKNGKLNNKIKLFATVKHIQTLWCILRACLVFHPSLMFAHNWSLSCKGNCGNPYIWCARLEVADSDKRTSLLTFSVTTAGFWVKPQVLVYQTRLGLANALAYYSKV